jgi:YVTN family beta-propeller protein
MGSIKNFFAKAATLMAVLVLTAFLAKTNAMNQPAEPTAWIYAVSPGSSPDKIESSKGYLRVIDPKTNRIYKSIEIGSGPHHFYPIKGTTKAYISHFGKLGKDGEIKGSSFIDVLDMKSNTIKGRIQTGLGPRHLTISGRYAYSANYDDNSVSKIDTRTDKNIWTSKAGEKPNYVEAVEGKIFIANSGESSVTVLDSTSGELVKTIATGAGPFNLAASCDTSELYTGNAGDNSVSFIDAKTLVETDRLSFNTNLSRGRENPNQKQRVNPRMSPDCRYLWIGNQRSGILDVVDTKTHALTEELIVAEPGGGTDILFFLNKFKKGQEGLAIATNRYSDHVTLISYNEPFRVIKRIATGLGSHYITFNEDDTKAFVSNRLGSSFSLINLNDKDFHETKKVKEKCENGSECFERLDQAYYVWLKQGVAHSSSERGGMDAC